MKKLNLYLFLLLVIFVALPQNRAEAACVISNGTLAYGQSNQAIKSLQSCLATAGYAFPAGATGYYGAQTKLAVQKFYKDKLNLPNWHGLSVGPLGKEKIMGLNGKVVSVSSGYKKAGSEATFKKYLAENNIYNLKGGMAVPAIGMDAAERSASCASIMRI